MDRRMFFGTALLGGGSSVVLGRAAWAQIGGDAHDHGRNSAVLSALIAQLESNVRGLREKVVDNLGDLSVGERLRSIAAGLRLIAVYEVESGTDAKLRAAIQNKVDRDGEESVLSAELDIGQFNTEAKALGFNQPPVPGHVDSSIRRAVLRAVLRDGMAAQFVLAATAFEEHARTLDTRAGRITRVALQASNCDELNRQLSYLAAEVVFACMFAFICEPCCIAASATWFAWQLMVWAAGC